MQEATPVGTGAMAALLGLNYAQVCEVAGAAAQGEVCEAANDNAPGQVVVSGHRAAVDRAIEIAKSRGARRAMLLPVSAPFHCALMAPARTGDVGSLAGGSDECSRCVPLVANVTADALRSTDDIRAGLARQVVATVRWRESVAFMAGHGVLDICRARARQGFDRPL